MTDALGWSFSAGQVFGIPVRIHWTHLALTAGWVLTSPTPLEMGWRLAVCVLLTFTVMVHELGHCFAARGVGGTAHKIVLWPLGGLAYTSGGRRAGSARQELIDDIKVVLGGPLTHIPLAALFGWLLVLQGEPWRWELLHPTPEATTVGGFWPYLCLWGMKMQVGLLLLNLFVPVYPLDGGRLLVDLLLFRFRRETVAKTIITLSVISGLALIPLGYTFLVLWVFVEIYQLCIAYKMGELAHHPMFARVPELAGQARRPRPGGSGVVLQFRKPEKKSPPPTDTQRQCPYCKRNLPREARMCGPCERLLPDL